MQLEQPEQEVTENETKPLTHYVPHGANFKEHNLHGLAFHNIL